MTRAALPRLVQHLAEDYPYPTVIVDAAHCWDKADPKPLAYLILDCSLTCCAVVAGGTSGRWRRTRRLDRQKGRDRDFYEADLALAQFAALKA